nr:ribonuclease H-like domain-containing protein [Tanacetum cinerariifolium]
MQGMLPGSFSTVLILLGPTAVYSSLDPTEYRTIANYLVWHSSSGLLMSRLAITLNRLERSIHIKGSTSGVRACRERERGRKARTTLLMAIPEDHLAKFHKMTDAKEMWKAINSRFGVSIEDANQKFLRSLPSSWSQVSLIMRTKPGVDTLNFNDLYNNFRVFEFDVKGSTGSSSSTQNVAFVSSDNTSSTNEVNIAYGVSTSSGHNSQKEGSSSYTDDLMYSFFANQSSGPQLDHKDLEQVDKFNLEEMDLKWQVAMISTRLKKEYRSKGNQDSKMRDAGNTGYKERDNGKRHAKQDEHKVVVTIDGKGVDWTSHAEDDIENYALMAFNSSNSGSDTKATSCSKSTISESNAKTSNSASCDSNSSVETLESVPKPVANKPKVVSEPKVWSDAPVNEEYESNSDDEHVTIPSKE